MTESRTSYITKRILSTQNVLSFVKSCEEKNWEQDLSDLTAQQSSDSFHDGLMEVFQRSFPTKRIKITDNNRKNITNALGTVARATKHEAVYDLYNAKKQEYHKRMDEKVRQNNIEYIQNGQNFQRAMWNVLNNETKKTRRYTSSNFSSDDFKSYILSTALKKF
ncbi:hypothetical protein HHI36_001251 [Cryptolaemus montrouzieri]|uniref:Uncharacterized protein n=1 Tax=Cryptolaemus montrouzieri TaxID=559131 RepID=A0ABD2P752_9CUCU